MSGQNGAFSSAWAHRNGASSFAWPHGNGAFSFAWAHGNGAFSFAWAHKVHTVNNFKPRSNFDGNHCLAQARIFMVSSKRHTQRGTTARLAAWWCLNRCYALCLTVFCRTISCASGPSPTFLDKHRFKYSASNMRMCAFDGDIVVAPLKQ